MIILITGKPGAGKSTIIEKLIVLYRDPKQWVVTKEIRSDGERVGFRATNNKGESEIISHKYDLKSDILIGQNRVDLTLVNKMFAGYDASPKKLTLIDEIGPIQLLSPLFLKVLKQLFKDPHAHVVATIHYKDKRLERYRSAKNIIIVEVSNDNRESLPVALVSILKKSNDVKHLKTGQFKSFCKLASEYLNNNQPIQLGKLLDNALPYVNDNRVKRTSLNKFIVQGNHGQHLVNKSYHLFTCDCDLFKGKATYENQAGICSHIQAVLIKF